MVKVSEVIAYSNSLVGNRIDEDNYAGAQCMDLTVHVMKRFFGWHPIGNAIALSTQSIPAGFTRIRVTSATQIKAGDVMVWGLGSFANYGHTSIVVEDGISTGTFISIDQNWINPSLEVGSPAAKIIHDMHGVWGVIRPNYEKEEEKPKFNLGVVGMFIYIYSGKMMAVWGNKRFHLNNMDKVGHFKGMVKNYTGNECKEYRFENGSEQVKTIESFTDLHVTIL